MRRLALLLAAAALAACTNPFTRAAQKGDVDSLRRQLVNGADVDQTDSNSETALMRAAEAHQLAAAQTLLDAGANPNLGTHFGTVLDEAAEYGACDIVKLMLEHGATPTAAALEHARLSGHAACERLLADALAAGPAVDAPPKPAQPVPSSVITSQGIDADRMRQAIENGRAPAPGGTPLSDVDQPSYSSPPRADDYAVVVGVENYASLPPAVDADRDADAVSRHLRALGVPRRNLVQLSDDQAGRARLAAYVEEWLPRHVKPDSRVFFYFSGHGAPDPATGQTYLVPWDGDPSYLKTTAYPLRRLYDRLARLKARQVLVALDTCFSGAGGRSVLPHGARPLITSLETLKPGHRTAVLAAAAANQITGVLDSQGHGVFTYYLLKGLNTGKRSAKDLENYLAPRVEDAARQQGREQTPQRLGPDLRF